MATNERKRQEQLAKKKQKAKQRKKARTAMTPSEAARDRRMVLNARRYPIHECVVNENWRTEGMASISLTRTQPNGLLLLGSYLVDTGCLGLKDTFVSVDLTPQDYRDRVTEKAAGIGMKMVPCALPLAHEIVYGGIDYATALGFHPHADFEFTRHILEERGTLEPCEVAFGRDGKPFYVGGPRDDTQAVLRQLEKTVGLGEGGARYMVPVGGPFTDDEDDFDNDYEEEDDDEETPVGGDEEAGEGGEKGNE